MSRGIEKSLIALTVSGVLIAPSAFATNGYFAHGYSTKEKGLAGAGVAYSQDAMSVANNPAGIAFMGERMDIGAALFSPSRSYTTSGNQVVPDGTGGFIDPAGFPVSAFCPPNAPQCQPPFTVGNGGESIDSDNELFLIPHFAYNWKLDSDSAIALAIYGNGGMNTEYQLSEGPTATGLAPNPSATGFADSFTIQQTPGTFGAGEAGVDLIQVFFNISYAQKIGNKSSWGAGVILAYQRFKATGLAGFSGFSEDPANLTNKKGHDASSGLGVKLGWQGEVVSDVALGVSYQSKIFMSEFDDYAGLFAEGGDFDIPATASIGLAWDTSSKTKLVFDIQTIFYSDVAAISNPIGNLTNGSCLDGLNASFNAGGVPTPASGTGCLGGANGAGFGWDDMTIVKLGYQWGDDTIWRVGLSHGTNPIPDTETLFNILAPAVIDTHLTGGFTMPLDSSSEISFSAMYALTNDVSGANPFDGGATTIELEMNQFEVQATYSMMF